MNTNINQDNEWQIQSSSEGSRVGASEPFSSSSSIVADDANHLVEFGAYLDAASQSAIGSLSAVRAHHSIWLERECLIALLIPGVGNNYLALCAGDTWCVKVDWDLIGFQFIITTIAIG